MTAALEGGEWSAARPGRTLPPGKSRYPFYRRLGGPQVRSGRAENLVPTGIRSRTVQPVVSRYTDWATGPILLCVSHTNLHFAKYRVAGRALETLEAAKYRVSSDFCDTVCYKTVNIMSRPVKGKNFLVRWKIVSKSKHTPIHGITKLVISGLHPRSPHHFAWQTSARVSHTSHSSYLSHMTTAAM